MAKKDEQPASTALAKNEDPMAGLLASPEEGDVDISGLPDPSVKPTDNERSIVDIRIAQKMSKVAGEIPLGDWYASTGQHLGKKLTAIFLWSGRAADFLDKTTLRTICRSPNGVMGNRTRSPLDVQGREYMIGGECKSCDGYYDGWDNLKNGLKRPLCSKLMTYPAVIVQADELDPQAARDMGLVLFRFKGSSTGAGKVINTYCANRPKYLFAFELTTSEETIGQNQPTFVTKVRPLGKVSPKWVEACKELVDIYGKLELKTGDDEQPEAGTATVPEDEDGLGF